MDRITKVPTLSAVRTSLIALEKMKAAPEKVHAWLFYE